MSKYSFKHSREQKQTAAAGGQLISQNLRDSTVCVRARQLSEKKLWAVCNALIYKFMTSFFAKKRRDLQSKDLQRL